VLVAPQRLEYAVGEAQAQDVLDRLHLEEVVHAEHSVLGEGLVQEPVEVFGGGEILAEGFLQGDPAAFGQADAGQGLDGGRDDRWRQGQVGDYGLA
jgi:hypothetical protein